MADTDVNRTPAEHQVVLVALRRIIRATDIYSQKLRRTVGLTTPQLLLLRTVAAESDATLGRIANELSLSQATVTTIVDRLEERGFVARDRCVEDRRRVRLKLTERGRAVCDDAPALLQDRFVERFGALPDWERSMITAALQRTADLMGASDLDAAPILLTGELGARYHDAAPEGRAS
jgi:DNA-binding MarR family transcriptional regulator